MKFVAYANERYLVIKPSIAHSLFLTSTARCRSHRKFVASCFMGTWHYRSPSVGTGVMCSKTSDGPIIKLLSRIENLENQLEYNRSRLQNIDCALNALRTSQRDILFDYYIRRHRKSVCRLAIDSHTDRSALYRRANRALDKYILAFFGTMGDKNAL